MGTVVAKMPTWAEAIRRKYLGEQSSMFILHGNVFDHVLHDGQYHDLPSFLTNVLLKDNKRMIMTYDAADGVRIVKQPSGSADSPSEPVRHAKQALPFLQGVLMDSDSAAVIINYAPFLAPAGDLTMLADQDRINLVTLHRWSLDRRIEAKDNVVFLLSDSLAALNGLLVSNPRIAAIHVPLPDLQERRAVVAKSDPAMQAEHVDRFARHTSGLKVIQISALLTPRPVPVDERDREAFIVSLLPPGADAAARAKKLGALTKGMDANEIRQLIEVTVPAAPHAGSDPQKDRQDEPDAPHDPYKEVLNLVSQRKREILEKECSGLIEFLSPKHDLSVVGGCDHIVAELKAIARNVRDGARAAVPMGLLFVGPMGTGKTFVANGFVKESGIAGVRLKNFRSKWVGATEANLEKVLEIVRALGPLFLIIDEGDRAFGGTSGESDGGTSSRVIARIKEFMSDPDNRGNVVFILMTNRPDKLDLDIKRAGRLDRKIPFFYASEPAAVESVLDALLRRYEVEHQLVWPRDREQLSRPLLGYSNADLEAVVLMAADEARRAGTALGADLMAATIADYLPPRDAAMLEYMELLAVFETSRRSLLPPTYRDMTPEDLNQRLQRLRQQLQL